MMLRDIVIWIALFAILATGATSVMAGEPSFVTSDYYSGKGPIGITCADFDGQLGPDLAVTNSVVSLNDKSVAVLFNDGTGSFTYNQTEDRYAMSCPTSNPCASDFDQDGDVDIAVADEDQCWSDGTGAIVILDNDGTGKFTYGEALPIAGSPRRLEAALLNADPYPDLIVTQESVDMVAVFINNGDGTFGAPTNYTVGDGPGWLCTGDVNGDGYNDIATNGFYSNDVTILCNNGDGTFSSCGLYSIGNRPMGLCLANLNDDDAPDLAVVLRGDDGIRILWNQGDGTFLTGEVYPTAYNPVNLAAADIDRDGNIDVAVAQYGDGDLGLPVDSVSILINTGYQSFESAISFPAGDNSWDIFEADFDGDCDDDFAVANYHGRSVSILRNETLPPIQNIAFDIKPGSCPNPLNINSVVSEYWIYEDDIIRDAAGYDADPIMKASPGKKRGVLPVAILGTSDFNIYDIDESTITLEGIPALRHSYEDASTPMADDAGECECNEFGPDGYVDLTLKFDKSDVTLALGDIEVGDIVPLTITGQWVDGSPFTGTDCVVIVGNPEAEYFASDGSPFDLTNYPNPFNPTTEISFSLPADSYVKLEVYNIVGQRVSTLVDEYRQAGSYTVTWNGRDRGGRQVASGVYFYRIEAGDYTESRKMLLMK